MFAQFTRMIKNFWQKSGFFVVLGLCAAAVGITAYATRPITSAPLPTLPPIARMQSPSATFMPTLPPASSVEADISNAAALPSIAMLPCPGEIISGFSLTTPIYNKTLGHHAIHAAIDIAASESVPVRACADGTVTKAYEDPMLGNVIEIDHGGFTGIYASLSTLSIAREGDSVSTGQAISFAGTCKGESHLGSHVHFAAVIDGTYTDPIHLLENR